MSDQRYVAAIDQGTTSTRCVVFDEEANMVGVGQFEHRQIFPQKGWVEHDPLEIWDNTRRAVAAALAEANVPREDIAAVGITNQRETTVVWNKHTGLPVYNAIVWQDTRTSVLCEELAGDHGADRWRDITGLRLNSYPAGPKIRWILDNVAGAREQAENGDLLFGTIDTWLLWNLTGGPEGDNGVEAVHATDVTNASRTLMMDLSTLQWDESICSEMKIPLAMLPEIKPSVTTFGHVRGRGTLAGVAISGILGDQQSAMFGQACFEPGDAKNTYGTGLFLLLNTGQSPKKSEHGLITTVCYQIEGKQPVYALEGSVAMGGALVQWLRDNLGIIGSAKEIEEFAAQVSDNGGVYIVPAFSGLFAPRWRPDARGVIVGLTRFANKHHLARAVIEATAYQTREVVDAMVADSGVEISQLKVDGGMVRNELLMQFQSDILRMEVIRPRIIETTALGAAFAAGLGVGFFENLDQLKQQCSVGKSWNPAMPDSAAEQLFRDWNKAVERTFDWEE
ncbi:glycerol kinase [Corynebacterium mustelae]|uniref:Glycerol kinase n=1 Tax=Corynebacterium mustelae TaxID=571915 RepID=A0A0G3H229_9CORY|nr:glycerol kinase GlpK [Corynebacterium mustelae]AKK05883.1 glycerol kinase [Corynebacterium mustelae]